MKINDCRKKIMISVERIPVDSNFAATQIFLAPSTRLTYSCRMAYKSKKQHLVFWKQQMFLDIALLSGKVDD